MALTAVELRRWTPIRIHSDGAEPVVDWAHLGGVPFDDPFLDETVQRALSHPFRMLFRHQTTLAELEALVAASPGLPVGGFVFHVSRCGSTLVSRALGVLPSVLAVSEPSALAGALMLPQPAAELVRWCRALVMALAQPRDSDQRCCVVKLDAWATLSLPVLRTAFPDTPWVFLHRDPVEVLVSHRGRRGMHTVPGALDPAVVGLAPADAVDADLDEYAAKVLGRVVAAAVAHLDDAALVLDHHDLPAAIGARIAPHFGIEVDRDGADLLAVACDRDAKNPALASEDDRARKAAGADDHLRAVADRWVRPALDDLLAATRP